MYFLFSEGKDFFNSIFSWVEKVKALLQFLAVCWLVRIANVLYDMLLRSLGNLG